jgi:hypothetical protein
MTQAGDEVLVWNLPVAVKPGANHLTIDQYNAEGVFSIDGERDEKLFEFSALTRTGLFTFCRKKSKYSHQTRNYLFYCSICAN